MDAATGSEAAGLLPQAYAPYRDPRDYILSWTDAIWIDRGLGRLTEHYDKAVKVHTAYGETYDWDHVVSNSLQKFASARVSTRAPPPPPAAAAMGRT